MRTVAFFSFLLFPMIFPLATPAESTQEEPVFALDISHWSGNITDADAQCWKTNGVVHVVAGTQVPEITLQQLEIALNAGLTVDAYVVLYWDFDITQQVQTALDMIQGVPVGRLWLDVEVYPGGRSRGQLEALMQEGFDTCAAFPCGIYTGKWWWDAYVGASTAFSSYPLWYAYYDMIPSLDTWTSQSFGGWPTPTGKQYDIGKACGISVDFNVMYTMSPPPGGGGATDPGEVGSITVNQPNASSWTTIDLTNIYSDPVVVMQPASFNGGHPTTIRVRNVTENSFEFQMDEWDYLDGAHTTETIGYLVMEAGVYQLQNGTRVEVGVVDANHNFTSVDFSQSFDTTPIVLTQVMTVNEGSAVVTRQGNAGTMGFEVKVQEEEANDDAHASETIGYIAIEPTVGTTGEMAYEAQQTPDAVTHGWYTIGFLQSYSNPIFLSTMQNYDGGNTAGLRYRQLGSTNVDVFVEEEKSLDTEINHTTEVVGYIAFDHPGSIDIVGPPFAPTGLSPVDGEIITTSSVTLSCNTVPDAFGYEFEIRYSNGGTWSYYYTYNSATNSQTFWPAYDDTAYQWRVRAQNIFGWGDWSDWVGFNFGDVGGSSPPPAPTGLSPDGGATITTSSVTLASDPISDATDYELEIWYASGGTWSYYFTYKSGTNSQTFWPAYDDTAYQWRVRAQNTYGWGDWSDWAEFNFGDVGGSSPPPAPTGLSPDGGIAISTSPVTLSTNPIPGVTQYELDIWYWNGSTWQHYYTYSTATNAQTFWPAVSNTAYQWRARAQNTDGWGAWSNWAKFNFQ